MLQQNEIEKIFSLAEWKKLGKRARFTEENPLLYVIIGLKKTRE